VKPAFPKLVLRALRKWRRRFWPSALQVVYHDRYNAAFPDAPVDALRADRILAFLASEGFLLRRSVHRPEPIWFKTLGLVHTAEYLERIEQLDVMTSAMGFEVTPELVERLVDYQRLQAGGTLMAVRRARQRGLAVNLGGGYHHAHADHGGGFCIFNDIALAIADERRRGFGGRILVIDLDLHDGDGTRDIFRQDASVHTYSLHARHWGPTEAVESTAIELGSKVGDETYLAKLEETLPPLLERFAPQLVIYLAGTDPAHDDVLGDWRISPEAMLERDLSVYRLCRPAAGRKLPLAIVLAGGYGLESWRYSARFLAEIEAPGRRVEPPSTQEITLKRYRYISSFFDPAELSGGGDGDEFGFTEEDLSLPGWAGHRETRFLSFYTRNGLELVLERSGFFDRLRDLGYAHPTLELQLEESGDTLRIFGDPEKREMLCELRLQRDRSSFAGFELLSVEWLLLQHPRGQFSAKRPALPGQKHPGLGLLDDVVALLIVACDRLHLDGLVFVPSQFHVAAYGRSHMKFVKPAIQQRFEALLALTAGSGLAAASRAIAEGRVYDADSGEPVRWIPEPMVLAVSPRMIAFLEQQAQEEAPPERTWNLRLADAP
jgi:acetoin utilization deacetylase AcuC-like enzyme